MMDAGLIAAVLAFVAIGGVGLAFAGGEKRGPEKKRLQAVSGNHAGPRKSSAADMAALKRRQTTQEALKDLAASEKQSRRRRVSVKGQIAQAGITLSLAQYWMMAAGLGAVLAIAALVVIGPDQKGLIAAAVGGFVGVLGFPRWILGAMVAGRQKKFANQLADAIDIIVRGVKSGLPLNQCLRIIAAESPDPLRTEFQNLCDAQSMGVQLDQSMQRMFERMPLPEVNFFAIVLIIQQKTGGNLSESLGNLSTVLRSRKLMKEKVKALSAEAKASAMIIGALPFCVMATVYVTKPDYIMILFTDPMGHVILLGSAIMMGAGIMIMRNMVNFKF